MIVVNAYENQGIRWKHYLSNFYHPAVHSSSSPWTFSVCCVRRQMATNLWKSLPIDITGSRGQCQPLKHALHILQPSSMKIDLHHTGYPTFYWLSMTHNSWVRFSKRDRTSLNWSISQPQHSIFRLTGKQNDSIGANRNIAQFRSWKPVRATGIFS